MPAERHEAKLQDIDKETQSSNSGCGELEEISTERNAGADGMEMV